jgi:Calcium binding
MAKPHYRRRSEPKREQRIADEILLDATTPQEQISAWYRYLKSRLSFPFVATYQDSGLGPLAGGAQIQVIGLARPELCVDSIYVRVMDGQQSIVLPLARLSAREAQAEDADPLADWNYWRVRHA